MSMMTSMKTVACGKKERKRWILNGSNELTNITPLIKKEKGNQNCNFKINEVVVIEED